MEGAGLALSLPVQRTRWQAKAVTTKAVTALTDTSKALILFRYAIQDRMVHVVNPSTIVSGQF